MKALLFASLLFLTLISLTAIAWDGHKVSVRDKAMASSHVTNPDFLCRSYHATSHIIAALETGDFPARVMLTLHPQRWTDL